MVGYLDDEFLERVAAIKEDNARRQRDAEERRRRASERRITEEAKRMTQMAALAEQEMSVRRRRGRIVAIASEVARSISRQAEPPPLIVLARGRRAERTVLSGWALATRKGPARRETLISGGRSHESPVRHSRAVLLGANGTLYSHHYSDAGGGWVAIFASGYPVKLNEREVTLAGIGPFGWRKYDLTSTGKFDLTSTGIGPFDWTFSPEDVESLLARLLVNQGEGSHPLGRRFGLSFQETVE
jgi:hypothetical protein